MFRYLIFIILFTLSACGVVQKPEHDARFDPILEQFRRDAKAFNSKAPMGDIVVYFDDPEADLKILGMTNPFSSQSDDTAGAEATCSVVEIEQDILDSMFEVIDPSLHGMKIIRIRPELKRADFSYLETVVYHELGHCSLDQDHRSDVGIMGTREYSLDEMGIYRYFYLEGLFNKKRVVYPDYFYSCEYYDQIPGLEKIYEVEYEAFDNRVSYKLFKDDNGDYCYSELE